MKTVHYFILALSTLLLTNFSSGKFPTTDSVSYHVYKLDSLHNYYLIYASKQDTLFKIVSPKSNAEKCKQIYVGGCYEFDLTSLYQDDPFAVMNQTEFYTYFDDSTSFKPEPENGIYDLHLGKNIRGLCVTDDSK